MVHNAVKRWLETERIGDQLGVLRAEAGFSISALARSTTMNRSRLSTIENNRALPRPEEVEEWAKACGAPAARAKELMALAAEGRSVHLRFDKKGAAQQQVYTDLTESAELVTEFSTAVLPATVQTSDYARAVIALHNRLGLIVQSEEEIDAGAAERQKRYRMMVDSPVPAYHFVIMETVLDLDYVGTPGAMTTQLHRLREAMQLDHVNVGFIRQRNAVPAIAPHNGFVFYSRTQILIETMTGDIRHEAPASEVQTYLDLMDQLTNSAVFGDEALELISQRLS